MRKNGKTIRKLKKISWCFRQPDWADNHGVLLPVRHPLVSPSIGQKIYLGDYESKEIEIIAKRLTTEDTVFEVGAGLGFLSAFCAKRVGSERVHTYEANPDLIPVIRETHARNGVFPTVTHAILGAANGKRDFRIDDNFWASSAHRSEGRSIVVPQIEVNAELERVRPSFLIVDIEGGEAEFFDIVDLSSVTKLCVETHPDILGDKALSQMFANILGQGLAIDFALIRKNVFFFHRLA